MQLKENILHENLGYVFFFRCSLWKKLQMIYFYFILKPSHGVTIKK